MAESPTSSLLEVVGHLQSRLLQNATPQKLLKSLKKLSALPITLDILARTGVWKTVSALTKYERVAVFATGLVAQWKKLVPVFETTTQSKGPELPEPELPEPEVPEPELPEPERRLSRKRTRDTLSKERELEGHGRESGKVSTDYDKPQEKKEDQLRPPRKPHKRHSQVIQDREGDNPKRRFVKPEVEVIVHHHHHQSKSSKSFKKKKAPVSDKGKGKCFELSQEELHNVASRGEGSNSSSKTSPKEKQVAPSAPKREKKTEGSSGKKKSGPPPEMAPGKSIHKPKDKDVQKRKVEKSELSVDSLHGETRKGELTPKVHDKEGSNKLKTQKRTEALKANKTPSKIQGTQESVGDDGFEEHLMSFESYLLYDQPKERRVDETTTSGSRKEGHQKLGSVKPEMESHSAVKKLPMQSSSQPKKNQAGAGSANFQKSSDGIPALPDHPSWPGSSSVNGISHTLSSVQTVYRPSFGEPNPVYWLKKQVPATPQENRLAEFPMSTVNSKIQVYSASRNSYTPKVLSLYEQCIKVLKKNIDLIYEVGQVPYNILTPVLERCSPDQLYRIEEYNPIFLEDSDNLWKVHCSRDFRREQPEEFECWREMYLRLRDAQEQRLRHLTRSIQLAHAKRPQGRQAKMLFISPTSRSPYDVPGRQLLRVEGTKVLKNASINSIQYTLSSRNSSDRGDSHAQDEEPSDGPSTSSDHLAPSGSNEGSEHSEKTPGKKVAPMLAESIKTFKNRLARC
ncbi:elongin-A-like [Trichosurus vulpecula]|uniref:elongin-A-like n=1 Tax=Trichosurus vulpecula TaxID=9337 RepID=UPI00186B01FD|nr:elongin-A-like [Trichosurus vulpecula]